MRSPLLLALTAVVAMAGCVLEPSSDNSEIVLRGPVSVTLGYAYDGTGAHVFLPKNGRDPSWWRSESDLWVRLDPETDTGQVAVIVHSASSCDAFRWDTFAGSLPFQEGGIATDVILHGDTGQDGPEFPRVKAKAAAWGEATVFANSVYWEGLPQRVSTWDAHFMYLDQGIRDQVAMRNSTVGHYDPARPHDAALMSGSDEMHVILRSRGPDGKGFDIARQQWQSSVDRPNQDRTHPYDASDTGPGTATLDIELRPGSVVPHATLRVVVTQRGTVVASAELSGASTTRTQLRFASNGDDGFQIQTTASGAGASYTIDASVHVDELVINMWGAAHIVKPSRSPPPIPDTATCASIDLR